MTHRIAAILAVIAAAVCSQAGAAEVAQWSSPRQREVAPKAKSLSQVPVFNVGISRVPKLGFRSTFGHVGGTSGEVVREVTVGTPADRMQLLAGDMILAVNGTPLKSGDSWYDAIAEARQCDGWITLKIRSHRSGVIRYRTTNILASTRRIGGD